MGSDEELKKQLAGFGERSAVSVVADIGNYVPMIKGVVGFATENGLKCIYITCTLPAKVVIEQLGSENIKADDLYFIDTISYLVGSAHDEKSQTIFVESPTMLEGIMLKVDTWLKKLKDGKKLVFLDSVSTLAMHNEGALISEFLHYFVNNLRGRGIRTVILSVAGQTPEEIENILRLVCDETVILKGEDSAQEDRD
jgi:KaiC/GvpD/RAD55 family RecA-like ATPase